jgi:hypothetical protein
MEFIQTTFTTQPQYDTIVFNSITGNTVAEIGSINEDGELEFFIYDSNASTTFFLNKENIQQLITHLQKQL